MTRPQRRGALAALALAAAGLVACARAAAAADDKMLVTCGSALKLEHAATRRRLHSQDVAWSQHSGRAIVTAHGETHLAAGYWTVHCGDVAGGNGTARGGKDAAAAAAAAVPGAPIAHGARVRLQSAASKRWLAASPEHRSPMTANNEVSGWDPEKNGAPTSAPVVWVVEWDGQGAAMPPPGDEDEDEGGGGAGGAADKKAPASAAAAAAEKKKKQQAAAAAAAKHAPKQGYWGGGTVVRLKHAGSGHWLSSYERARFGHPLTGQQEVSTATGRPGGMEQWRAAEGVFLPVERGLGGGGKEGEGGDGGGKDEL